MSTNSNTEPGIVRRILSSPPARVLVLGFILLMMMGLNSDVMTSYAGEPAKSVLHIMALAIAGISVYLGYAYFIEQRDVSELAVPGMGENFGTLFGLLKVRFLFCRCPLCLALR